jgi:hypothetical protein
MAKARNYFAYPVETAAGNDVLIPESRRSFVIPVGKHGFGQANVCYMLDSRGRAKKDAKWIESALEYVSGYAQEDAAGRPESETDPEIADIVESTIEKSAEFQRNPRIRHAIEQYAMDWALRRLQELKLKPETTTGLRRQSHPCLLRARPHAHHRTKEANYDSRVSDRNRDGSLSA